MEGMDKITARIIADAEREIAEIQRENDEKIEALTAEAQSAAEQESLELLTRGRRAAEERRERLSSSAAVECHKLELAAKQELLEETFAAAVEQLCSLPREEYIALIASLAAEAAEGGEQMILSPRDAEQYGTEVIAMANTALRAAGTRGELTLSSETRPIPGGFILSSGDVELNCAFDTLVRLRREKLEKEVAKILFPNE